MRTGEHGMIVVNQAFLDGIVRKPLWNNRVSADAVLHLLPSIARLANITLGTTL